MAEESSIRITTVPNELPPAIDTLFVAVWGALTSGERRTASSRDAASDRPQIFSDRSSPTERNSPSPMRISLPDKDSGCELARLSDCPSTESSTQINSIVAVTLLVLICLTAVQVSHPRVFVDDAAISFRYAHRLALGKGFTYNDHERVQGASNPLYVLVLGGLERLLGANVESSAGVIARVGFVATTLLVFGLARQLGGSLVAAFASATALALDWFFRWVLLYGLESGISTSLGLAAILAALANREILAGTLVGFALLNKLDAILLASALALAWIVANRRIPWRGFIAGAAVLLPWMVFAKTYFGSFLPNSLLVKLSTGQRDSFDPFDIWRLADREGFGYLLAAAVPVGLAFGFHRKMRIMACIALGGWFLAHFMALSVVDLSAPFPWYRAVLFPPLYALAGAGLGAALTWSAPAKRLAILVAFTALLEVTVQNLYGTCIDLRNNNPLRAADAFDMDRRAAGNFLAQESDSSEVVESGYGWVAFPLENPFNDASGLNSRLRIQDPSYQVWNGSPWTTGDSAPARPSGMVPLEIFEGAHSRFPGYSWFTVFGRPDSKIARSGRRAYLLSELLSHEPPSSSYNLRSDIDVAVPFDTPLTDECPSCAITIRGFVRLTPTSQDSDLDPVDVKVFSNDTAVWAASLRNGTPLPLDLRISASRGAEERHVRLRATEAATANRQYASVEWSSVRVRFEPQAGAKAAN